MDLSAYFTNSQIDEIITTISNTCTRYRAFDKEFNNLFYEPYTNMRKKQSVTSAVISAFSPKWCHIDGFTSQDINYGLNDKLSQPELISENVIIQIYSNGSNLDGKPIAEKSALYNNDLTNKPIFLIIVFYADKNGWLSKIDLKLPNKDGKIISTETIYEQPKLIKLAI